MIQLQLGQAVFLYTCVLGALIGLIWLYTEFTVRRSHRFLEKQNLWRCVFCGYTYLDEGARDLSQCPRCGSYNSTEDAHARFVPTRKEKKHAEDEEETAELRRNPSKRKRPQQRRRGPRRR